MKTYFAGNTGVKRRELLLTRKRCPRLFSYHFMCTNFYNSAEMMKISQKNKIDLFLDSGAFSAWTQGIEINIQEYIDFIKKHEKSLTVYANLDVIAQGKHAQPNRETAELTLKNQKIMEKAGLNPLPCFHFGEPFEFLEYYIENYDYLAMGVAGNSGTKLIPWLDECFSRYICDPDGLPKIKVHGFAVTSVKLMVRYPWFSVDSTSWVVTGRNGSIYVPRYRAGKWIYDETSWKVAVSFRSPSMKELGQHIDTMSPHKRRIVEEYIHSKGFVIGKSTFKKVDQSHELSDNERWAQKKPTNKSEKRLLEIIEEEGLGNRYQLRDQLNIQYFIDLENSLPKYPWVFSLNEKPRGFDFGE